MPALLAMRHERVFVCCVPRWFSSLELPFCISFLISEAYFIKFQAICKHLFQKCFFKVAFML